MLGEGPLGRERRLPGAGRETGRNGLPRTGGSVRGGQANKPEAGCMQHRAGPDRSVCHGPSPPHGRSRQACRLKWRAAGAAGKPHAAKISPGQIRGGPLLLSKPPSMQQGDMGSRNGSGRRRATLRVSLESSLLDVRRGNASCGPPASETRPGQIGVSGGVQRGLAHRRGTRSMKMRAQEPGSRDASHRLRAPLDGSGARVPAAQA